MGNGWHSFLIKAWREEREGGREAGKEGGKQRERERQTAAGQSRARRAPSSLPTNVIFTRPGQHGCPDSNDFGNLSPTLLPLHRVSADFHQQCPSSLSR